MNIIIKFMDFTSHYHFPTARLPHNLLLLISTILFNRENPKRYNTQYMHATLHKFIYNCVVTLWLF